MEMSSSSTSTSPYINSSSSSTNSDNPNSSSTIDNGRRSYSVQLPAALSLIQSPLSILLEYSGIVPSAAASHRQETEQRPMVSVDSEAQVQSQLPNPTNTLGVNNNTGEVSIQIIRQENGGGETTGVVLESDENSRVEETVPLVSSSSSSSLDGNSNSGRDEMPYQRFNIQQLARWVEQILPFSLLLLVVFVRQHLQGFFVTVWITAIIFKSNDILRRQTALKGERKSYILIGITVGFMIHVVGVYWWFRNDDLFYPLAMIPPRTTPAFWHAVFIILVNDTMARQAAMAFKCLLLLYYKNGKGHNFRRQGQILTLVEYTLLFYRALLPAPVWYRFFLNKEYGSLFSSLTTGLYLTFKLTMIVDKVQSLFAAIRALWQKQVHYGSYATGEQVKAAGDLCAICQEKMQAPILLRCKHIFCEECVSEWLERERTCPLCRALVKPAALRSFGDGSTSLFFQLF